jgi:riboflavin synthase
MADLEITNRSLLSINSSLEATKNKQAKEIRELRRKLRESRLILPPRAYREYKSSLEPQEEAPADDDDDEDSEVEDAAEGNGDEIYKRVKHMLEGLISSGKKALETKVEDFAETKGLAKVLTAEEVKSWHRSNDPQTENDDENSDADSLSVSQADISITSSTNGDDDDYDEDGDTSFLSRDTFFKSSGPPIRISEAI